jgi:hypothetical protein
MCQKKSRCNVARLSHLVNNYIGLICMTGFFIFFGGQILSFFHQRY